MEGGNMRKVVLYLALTVFSALLIGCSESQNAENQSDTDGYNEVRKTAWNFVKVVVDNNYEFLDKNYEGKEALSVSFEDKKNSVVSTPLILIEPDTNKVIGYMTSE